MAVLQVRDIDNRLYNALKTRAKTKHRSISQEVIRILEKQLAGSHTHHLEQTEAFLNLSGAWQDERPAGDIVNEIRSARNDSKRSGVINGLFD